MKINIVSNKVLGLSISDKQFPANQDGSETHNKSDLQALFGARVEFGDDHFHVIFKTAVYIEEGKCLELEYQSRFDVDGVVNEEFKAGNFAFVNAPAIAYPFLRAFISNLALNAGYSPVMLPSINFVAMKDKIRSASV